MSRWDENRLDETLEDMGMDDDVAGGQRLEPPIWKSIPHSEGSHATAEPNQTLVTRPRGHRGFWIALSVLDLGAAATGIGLASSGGSAAPGAGMAPADFVVSSTQNTLAQHTADVVFSGSVSVAGKTIPLTGTGQADFTTNDFTGIVSESSPTASIVERELLINGHFYMGVTADGHDISEITGGAEWIDIPIADQGGSTSPGFASVDPLTQIQMLEKKGATVVPLGTSVIDGDTVSGFSVTPSHAEVLQNIQKEFATGQFSAEQQQQILNASKALGSISSDVWFDSSGILRREAVNIGGGTSGATGKVDMTFQNYGTPVNIEPPAPGNTITFSQFSSDVKSAEASQG